MNRIGTLFIIILYNLLQQLLYLDNVVGTAASSGNTVLIKRGNLYRIANIFINPKEVKNFVSMFEAVIE